MAQPYIYSISADTLSSKVHSSKLLGEIVAAAYGQTLLNVGTEGDVLEVEFGADLISAEKTALDTLLGAHDGMGRHAEAHVQGNGAGQPRRDHPRDLVVGHRRGLPRIEVERGERQLERAALRT